MYGRYNLNSLRGVKNTINALHDRQTYYERTVRQRDFNSRRSDMDAVNYNFDTLMGLCPIHIVCARYYRAILLTEASEASVCCFGIDKIFIQGMYSLFM